MAATIIITILVGALLIVSYIRADKKYRRTEK